jgi:cytochrome c biogenesis protein
VLPSGHIAITDEEKGLSAAERAFRQMHLKSERIVRPDRFSLFAERNRISEMAVYIVHTSLLLIFLGTIVDGLYGWRGFLMLTPGAAGNQIEMKNGATQTLPFSIRCDGTGEETYTDGTPKRWWSKLAVVSDGRDISSKEIVVNDPLVYQGVRFYQASYGRTGKLDRLILNAVPKTGGDAGNFLRSNQIVSRRRHRVQVEFNPRLRGSGRTRLCTQQ